ncbi:MAG: hypothetical protein JWO53_983 [Chlamydiia bacterium]|nr:hypothetical protein [Chlamydiia bacterium]
MTSINTPSSSAFNTPYLAYPLEEQHTASLILGATLSQYGGAISKMPPDVQKNMKDYGKLVGSLNLHHYELTSQDMSAIGSHFPNLETIDFSNTKLDGKLITDSNVMRARFFQGHKNLRFNFTAVQNSLIHPKPIEECSPDQILTSALIKSNGDFRKLSDSTFKAVHAIGHLISTIDVRGYALTTEGLKSIARTCLKMQRLLVARATIDGKTITRREEILKILSSKQIEVILEEPLPKKDAQVEESKVDKFQFDKIEQPSEKRVENSDLITTSFLETFTSLTTLELLTTDILQKLKKLPPNIKRISEAQLSDRMASLTVANLEGCDIEALLNTVHMCGYTDLERLLQQKNTSKVKENSDEKKIARMEEVAELTSAASKLSLQPSAPSRSKKPAPKAAYKTKNERTFIAALEAMNIPKTTESLDLRLQAICREIPHWAAIIRERYPEIRLLHLPVGSRVDDMTGKELSQFKNLKELDIAYCDKKDMRGLAYLTRLQGLHNARAFENDAQDVRKDEKLQFDHSMLAVEGDQQAESLLQTFDPKAIDHIAAMKGLRVLRLGGIKGIGDRALLPLSHLEQLEEFSVSSTILTRKGLAPLLGSAFTLKKLNITGCTKLNDAALVDIAKRLPHLTELRIGENDFTSQLFKTLFCFTSLNTLVLGRFKKIEAQEWLKLPQACPKLERISLKETHQLTPDVLMIWQRAQGIKFYKLSSNGQVLHRDASDEDPVMKVVLPKEEKSREDEKTKKLVEMAMNTIQTPLVSKSEGMDPPEAKAKVSITDLSNAAVDTLDIRKLPYDKNFTSHMQQINTHYPHLETLRLPFCPLNEQVGEIISSMPNVTKLDLTFCDISNPASLQYLPKKLQAFHYGDPSSHGYEILWNTQYRNTPEVNIEALPKDWEKKYNSIPDFTDSHAVHLATFTHLREINIGKFSQFTTTGIRSLASLKELQTLGIIGAADLDDTSFELISTQFPKLEKLYCAGNDISDRGISALTNLKNLYEIVIGPQSRVTTKGWKQLANCTRLKRLCVTMDGTLTDEVLFELSKLPYLEVLHIANASTVSIQVVVAFGKNLPNCKLCID